MIGGGTKGTEKSVETGKASEPISIVCVTG